MNHQMTFAGVIFLSLLTFSACGVDDNGKQTSTPADSEEARMQAEKELRAANDQFYAALNAMFAGELGPMNAIWLHGNNTTDMGPFGGRLTGWDAIGKEFEKEAAMKFGGKVVCKDLHVYVGSDMGYTICVEEGENMSTDGKPVLVRHRATNIFHLADGQWKMVHHHTDLAPQLTEATGIEGE
jgi:ketosteroid isomerase-like protein